MRSALLPSIRPVIVAPGWVLPATGFLLATLRSPACAPRRAPIGSAAPAFGPLLLAIAPVFDAIGAAAPVLRGSLFWPDTQAADYENRQESEAGVRG
jgi:hypothetical protein